MSVLWVMATPWDVGADGRVLLAGESSLRLIGLDGNVAAEWPFDGQQSATTIVATRSGYAIAFSNSTLLFTDLDGITVSDPPCRPGNSWSTSNR